MHSLPLSLPCSRCGLSPKTKQRLYDDETFLTEEIRQLDEAILRLTERKARAFIQLNDIRTPYKNLPDEVLSAIFEHAEQISRPPFDMTSRLEPRTDTYRYLTPLDRYFPMHVLSAVCSRWRRIAWSTRGLWSFLNLNVGDVINNKHGLMLPRYYFENLGMRQMTLIVDCTMVQESDSFFEPLQSSRTRDKEVSMKPLRDLIFLVYPQKIAQLRLISPPPEWLLLLSNRFVALKGIELSWPLENGRYSRNTISPPQIRSQCFGGSIELPWVQMTHLQLQDISFQLASQLLISCPNLISYSVWSVTSGNPAGVPNNQVILPHLETFRWTWTSCDAHAKLLRLLHLPSLHYLYWTEHELLGGSDSEYEQHCPAVGFFFSNLPAHQIQLYLCQFGFFKQYRASRRFYVILSSTPRLKYLGIHEPFVSQTDPLRMVATTIKEARQRNRRALSELERVSLTGQACLSVVESHSVIMLLDERRISGMTAFRLDIPGPYRIEFWWNDAVRSILRNMVSGGFELKIYVEGKMVVF